MPVLETAPARAGGMRRMEAHVCPGEGGRARTWAAGGEREEMPVHSPRAPFGPCKNETKLTTEPRTVTSLLIHIYKSSEFRVLIPTEVPTTFQKKAQFSVIKIQFRLYGTRFLIQNSGICRRTFLIMHHVGLGSCQSVTSHDTVLAPCLTTGMDSLKFHDMEHRSCHY
jgi:hypothetical protein